MMYLYALIFCGIVVMIENIEEPYWHQKEKNWKLGLFLFILISAGITFLD